MNVYPCHPKSGQLLGHYEIFSNPPHSPRSRLIAYTRVHDIVAIEYERFNVSIELNKCEIFEMFVVLLELIN